MTDAPNGGAELPNPDDQRKHLEFIQAIISRMSGASTSAKSWCLPLVTATYGYSLVHPGEWQVALLGVLATFLFGFMDAHYLDAEHEYIALYKRASGGATGVRIYDLNPERAGEWRITRRTLASWSIAPFYGLLLAVGLGVTLVGLCH